MNTDLLLEVLSDQKLELAKLADTALCERSEEALINLNSKKAQVVIGVRRSGKSTLCFNALHKAGVKFAYVNFDDERLINLRADDLNEVLRCLYQTYGQFEYLFIDEIQNIDEWYLFVNRLLRQGMHVIVTGSNAKLLSGELATHLTGRHNQIELYPFSFAEYCKVKDVDTSTNSTMHDALRRRAFEDYLHEGGFPEITNGDEDADTYIDSLVTNILERDIIKRFNIRYKSAFKTLANHLLNNVPCDIVYKSLQKLFSFKTDHTTENYVSYLQQAYLLMGVHKYSPKSKERVRNSKCYAVDVALMNGRRDAFAKDNIGWRLETAVYIQLKRRFGTGYDIYYYTERGFATDFVVCRRSQAVLAVQVSYDISDSVTKKREINGLIKGAKATGAQELWLITAYQEEHLTVGGYDIAVKPCYKWMLEP